MNTPYHPFRDATIRVFQSLDTESEFIARFVPYDTYPIFFTGSSADEAKQKAEDFRMATILKHEANYIKKLESIKIAQGKRHKRK